MQTVQFAARKAAPAAARRAARQPLPDVQSRQRLLRWLALAADYSADSVRRPLTTAPTQSDGR